MACRWPVGGLSVACRWPVGLVLANCRWRGAVLHNTEISMRVKTPMCQTRNCFLHNEKKAVFLVQQGRSAIFRRRKSYALTSSADKTYLVSLGGRSETGAIPVFHR